jgi:Xaa-Pro aminopeptidase
MVSTRLTNLRELMRMHGLDALIVSSLPNIRYLSGFTGSHALCVVTLRRAFFITDSRYTLQSRAEVGTRFRRLITRTGLLETIAHARLLPRRGRTGFEAHQVTVAQHRALKRLFPGYLFQPLAEIIENLSQVKDADEVANIKAAARISDRAFLDVLPFIRPGAREREIAARISFLQKVGGAEGDAFDPIVASGERSALPHARASDRRIRRGDMVVLDFGCTVNGYRSDVTRTVAVGKASRQLREVYRTVLEAQEGALAAARDGITARALDAVARGIIETAGYGRHFIHSLGHGLGLHIHERPRISALSRETLKAGMVITVEPGIYLPGWGGVRIEDDVVLTTGGCKRLTFASKELLVL